MRKSSSLSDLSKVHSKGEQLIKASQTISKKYSNADVSEYMVQDHI